VTYLILSFSLVGCVSLEVLLLDFFARTLGDSLSDKFGFPSGRYGEALGLDHPHVYAIFTQCNFIPTMYSIT